MPWIGNYGEDIDMSHIYLAVTILSLTHFAVMYTDLLPLSTIEVIFSCRLKSETMMV